jgi:hypothetical protein
MKINTFADLLTWMGLDEDPTRALYDDLSLLGKWLYKTTDCGAWMSVLFDDTEWVHCSEVDPMDTAGLERHMFQGFVIGTIVEGSEATRQSKVFQLGTSFEEVDEFIADLEEWADQEWKEANEND